MSFNICASACPDASEILQYGRGRTSLTFEKLWLVAFAFGLLHGLGFAGALSEIGLPPDEVPIALLFFNVGVEAGQLMFVTAVLMLLWILGMTTTSGRLAASTRLVVVYGIGTLAMYWFVERAAAIFSFA